MELVLERSLIGTGSLNVTYDLELILDILLFRTGSYIFIWSLFMKMLLSGSLNWFLRCHFLELSFFQYHYLEQFLEISLLGIGSRNMII